ncbi:MAG: amino acid adenylation domain-containing protein, partial [Nitrosopumilus sp.]|nr:amino acid adenylation domain-containing protein [Nitrosopumilus sp.]
MSKHTKFSCYVIGDDNITLECATILAGKHHLLGMVSSSVAIKKWCNVNAIPYIESVDAFKQAHSSASFDYLFSIANGEILSNEILNLPRYYAINYHNAPLPKYAGLYATSWAILNGERQHAISWHIMCDVVDAGFILKQVSFPIEDFDTALSLNLTCFEQGIKSFRELVDELATNTTVPVEQNLSARSYYGLNDKPPNFGFISWNECAETIDRLCRALTFGNYNNQLAVAKVIIKGDIFVVTSHKKLSIPSDRKPGTIVHISNEALEITTKTDNIAILELTDLTGKNHSIQSLVSLYNLKVNSQLDTIETQFLDKLLTSPANNAKRENFWVNEFSKSGVLQPSFLASLRENEHPSSETNKITKIPSQLLRKLEQRFDTKLPLKNVLLTAVLIYLYRLNNYCDLSVEFSDSELKTSIFGLEKFLSGSVPMRTNFDSSMTFIEALDFVSNEKEKIFGNHSYLKDIAIRYPQLTESVNKIEINITFVDYKEIRACQNSNKLNLNISEDGSWFCFNSSLNAKKYSDSYAFINNMKRHFLTLLGSIISNPSQGLFEFAIIDSKEKNKLMDVWNNTNCKYDYKKMLHQYFEEQVIKTPLLTAAVFDGKSITYKKLNEQANQLAHYLRNQGTRPNNLIGISLDRSLEMLICILGVLKSGGAYLPLDPNYPAERISFMLNDSKSNLLLMNQDSIKRMPGGFKGKIIDVNCVLKLKNLAIENPEIVTKSSNLAYVIYTSGTSGKPKGVAISHRAICNHMVWMRKEYTYKPTDVFVQKTPFSFDASVWEFFMPLLVGAKLILAPQDTHASSERMIQLIKKHSISVLQLVPSMLKELLSTEGFNSCESLKHVFCGGETLLPETINAFFKQKLSGAKLHNLYGPTEATIDAITSTCVPKDGRGEVSRIGKPIMNTKVYVLDSKMQMVPVGISGDLYISGEGLADGYLSNPEITEQKFIPNPFSNKKNDRLYKTGDLVKWQSDGNMQYLGRHDSQVKIRGYRIEVGEIESCMEKITAIRQCLVKPERNQDESVSLSAYLVVEPKSQLSANDIRFALKKNLPDYMIPNRFFIADKLLTTPSGKVDRKTLPVSCSKLSYGKESVAPGNDIERALKRIWTLVLKVENLGIHDDFFELGGSSLSGMSILSLIQEQLTVDLSIRILFDFPTIYALAKVIKKEKQGKTANFNSPIVTLQPEGKKTPLFLVHPVGGSVFWYKLLGKYLDKNRPLYGIQDPGLDKKELIFSTIEEMAAAYVKSIQAIQANGPYLLGGASFGST